MALELRHGLCSEHLYWVECGSHHTRLTIIKDRSVGVGVDRVDLGQPCFRMSKVTLDYVRNANDSVRL